MLETFFTLYLKIFFMMTPFFVLSVFLSLSKKLSKPEKTTVIFRSSIAVTVASLTFLLFGKYIFSLFGITLDAFKIGAGTVLFLSALEMIKGGGEIPETSIKKGSDFSIVPLAIPSTIGPGLIGILMVIGAEMSGFLGITLVILSLLAAVISLAGILLLSNKLQHLIGEQGLEIIPKITGLFVSAIGAQIIFSGIQGFLLQT
ncbi:MAG: multiple antibiotic resistance protein [Psychromonas sp.]|jgi:multiple antibiotic resistance protein|uniref:MarC family protein n=1 Tax=Psychromonas sp. TaxID=1884585 RepID=UPI0039E55BA8